MAIRETRITTSGGLYESRGPRCEGCGQNVAIARVGSDGKLRCAECDESAAAVRAREAEAVEAAE